MTRKWITIIITVIFLLFFGWYLFKKEIGSVSIPAKNTTEKYKDGDLLQSLSYLHVPEGFGISVFAKDLPGARAMLLTGDGILVSQTSEGKITLLQDKDNDGTAETRKVILDKLNKPHGMEMWGEGGANYLYVAEQDTLSRYSFGDHVDQLRVDSKKKLVDLPSSLGDRHFTRSLLWLPSNEPDGYSNTLLISIGSSCDVCNEKNNYGSILSFNIVTNELKSYATGLRNAVFMTTNPVDGTIWATEMGRDGLGDNIPPDEINIIEKGKNYGWPICYGKNVHDTNFDKNTYIRNPCMEPFETESLIDLPAHSAPLGLSFVPEEGWPETYWYNLLVSYHGSWNRSEPTGYKVVRIKLDSKGRYLGTEDFITGWLDENGKKNGRPVDIKILPGGTAYISDDEAGVIYRLYRTKE
jgi:glucose/arabinose dehydrogenase